LVIALAGTYFYGDNEAKIAGNDHNFAALWPENAKRFGLSPPQGRTMGTFGYGARYHRGRVGGQRAIQRIAIRRHERFNQ
jgi:hypothetical protein